MKHLFLIGILISGFILLKTDNLLAQSSDTTLTRRNVFKLNLSSKALYQESYMMSYERVLNKNRTFGVSFGYVELPFIFGSSSHFSSHAESQSGFMVGGEYRFYLQKENKYNAPHGVYLGPYLSYYYFHNNREITSDLTGVTSQGNLKSEISFTNIGFQIGYQFVVHDRWTFDFVFMGPSIANYTMDLNLTGNFNVDEQNEIVKALMNKFPMLGELIDSQSVSTSGTTSKWSSGYRYSILVGYKFGRKRH